MNAPWYFAGANQAEDLSPSVHSVPGFEDPQHDILLALMDWVENGNAPNQIIATKWVNDSTYDQVLRQRPICKFPLQAQYVGGDIDKPESWQCKSLYLSNQG
jgi:feruloyl esterase